MQPLELAGEAERKQILLKQAETKRFFRDMEQNILRKVRQGQSSTETTLDHKNGSDNPMETSVNSINENSDYGKVRNVGGLRLVRTISSLDGIYKRIY